MSIKYVIHDVDFDEEGLGVGPVMAPATRAAMRMQGVGEIGAILLVPCAEAPLLITTGFGSSRPDQAYPLFWIKRSRYAERTHRIVRLEWEPVVGAAPAGMLPASYDMEAPDHTLTCLEVELCQVLMMLTIECGRRALNVALPSHIVEWYRTARQRPLPDLSSPLFDGVGQVRPVWTRRAVEHHNSTRRAARETGAGGEHAA